MCILYIYIVVYGVIDRVRIEICSRPCVASASQAAKQWLSSLNTPRHVSTSALDNAWGQSRAGGTVLDVDQPHPQLVGG